MSDQRQNFCRALSVLNSLLIPVFVLSLIERLNLSFLLKSGFIFILLIIGPLKIYCMSAMGGCILEIISGEEFVLRIRRARQNARELWPGFLIVFVIIFLIDFFFLVPVPLFRVWRPLYLSLLAIIAAYVLARWTINKKYLGPLGFRECLAPMSSRRKPGSLFTLSQDSGFRRNDMLNNYGSSHRCSKFNLSFLLVIIPACLLEPALVRAADFIHTGDFNKQNLLAFMFNYIHVFEFIFCSLCILDGYPEINEKFSRQKEIFLIDPLGSGVIRSLMFSLVKAYPAFFVVLKALSPKTYKFREFDQVLWHERYYKSNVLVGITCYTSNCYEAYKIAKEFKKRGSKVVMGGPHVTHLPDEALAFCDSVVIGQAEGVWRQVVSDYENGELKLRYKGAATEADYYQVHEELLNSPPSIAKDFLETTRGCKFRCHFCAVPGLSDGHVHLQPIDNFVELIKKIKPHYSNLTFIDNNIYSNPGYAKELFAALKPLKIKWSSECTIDIAKNREILKLARESGCAALGIGYEVSGGSLEKNQGGKFALAQKYIEYTKMIKKAGIKIKGQFIFGFDSDNLKTLFQLWKFCFSIMPRFTALSLLTPMPGAGLYRDMLAQNRIISLNWRSYTCFRLVVRHPRLDPAMVSFFYPLLHIIFFMTTSSFGLIFLAIILFSPSISAVRWWY